MIIHLLSVIYGITILLGAGQGPIFPAHTSPCKRLLNLETLVCKCGIAGVSKCVAISYFFEAVALGLLNFVRVLGGAIGIAIASATLNSTLHRDLPSVVPSTYINDILEYPDSLRTMVPSQYVQPVIEIYLRALQIVWYVITAMSVACKLQSLSSFKHVLIAIAFVCSLAVGYHPIKRDDVASKDGSEIKITLISLLMSMVKIEHIMIKPMCSEHIMLYIIVKLKEI